jgi:NADPH:quinone reductase-like Zn-dependent oxidoreductase
MHAWEIAEFGKLRWVERKDETLGPFDARIRITACSINYRDHMVVAGTYNPRQKLPLVPLSDGVGIVEEIGANVDNVKVGDRVAAIFAQRWIAGPPDRELASSTLGSPLDGMARTHAVLRAEGLVHVPAHLSDEEAATLPCAAVTAWSALFELSSVSASDVVLVQGTGGVSMFALQLARAAGARVIVTSSSDEKLAIAKQHGAYHTINYKTEPEWGRAARALTSNAGVDHVIGSAVPARSNNRSPRCATVGPSA